MKLRKHVNLCYNNSTALLRQMQGLLTTNVSVFFIDEFNNMVDTFEIGEYQDLDFIKAPVVVYEAKIGETLLSDLNLETGSFSPLVYLDPDVVGPSAINGMKNIFSIKETLMLGFGIVSNISYVCDSKDGVDVIMKVTFIQRHEEDVTLYIKNTCVRDINYFLNGFNQLCNRIKVSFYSASPCKITDAMIHTRRVTTL